MSREIIINQEKVDFVTDKRDPIATTFILPIVKLMREAGVVSLHLELRGTKVLFSAAPAEPEQEPSK